MDKLETVALRQWLARNGWDEVFLDLDPQGGLLPVDEADAAIRTYSEAKHGTGNVTWIDIRKI